MMSIALLIIDMQKGCKNDTKAKELFDGALEYINAAGQLFREHGRDVIVIQDVEVGEGPGSQGFELVDELVVSEGDYFIRKEYNSAFWKTELDDLLKKRNIEFLVLCGFAAEYCVLFTYNGAVERGYNAVLLQKGVAGFDTNEVKSMQLLRPVISYEALEYLLKI
jgi:nicotinamidase-related amidase